MIKLSLSKISNNFIPRWIVLIIDLGLVGISFFMAYFIRFNLTFKFDAQQFLYQLPVILILALLSFLIVGTYKGIVRHTGLKDADNIFIGVNFLATFSIILVLISRNISSFTIFNIPASIIFIHYLLTLFALISSRFLFKAGYRYLTSELKFPTNVMIYGAGNAGLMTRDVLANDNSNNYKVIGFIDDNLNKAGKRIDRVKVFGFDEIDLDFIEKNKLKEIIISINNISQHRLMEITDILIKFPVKVKIVPPVEQWMDGNLNLKQIKDIKIENLLERDSINIINKKLEEEVDNKVVLVTGAAGSIGGELSRQLSQYNYKKLILLDQAESPLYDIQQELKLKKASNFKIVIADIANKDRIDKVFETYNPDFIFHAAAYKHVPIVENNPFEGVNVNIKGTKILTDLALKYNAEKFVMVSTDKAVNPTNVMGATKRVSEMYATCLNRLGKTKFIITRFGNVLGSNGSVIPLFKNQIEAGGPLTVTHKDITRYFMTIPEACQLVLEAGVMGNGGEIFVFDMGKSVKVFNLAKKMIKLSGLRYPEDIDIKITGLRPGEKLYEELLANGENTLPTYHEKIMIAKTQKLDCDNITKKIDSLSSKLVNLNDDEIVLKIKKIVPEFISKNSAYEALDNLKQKKEIITKNTSTLAKSKSKKNIVILNK